MIAQLSGTAVLVGANWVVVEVQGVGFKVLCPPGTAAGLRSDESCSLVTSLLVREDALTLFGFTTVAERDTFELLQTSSGIGARTALAVISVLSPQQVVTAIRSEDLVTLMKVPGIGRKTAQKMVLDLGEKVLGLAVEVDAPSRAPTSASRAWREQVAEGLQGLGWSLRDAELACDRVADQVETDPDVSLGTLMKAALASLARS